MPAQEARCNAGANGLQLRSHARRTCMQPSVTPTLPQKPIPAAVRVSGQHLSGSGVSQGPSARVEPMAVYVRRGQVACEDQRGAGTRLASAPACNQEPRGTPRRAYPHRSKPFQPTSRANDQQRSLRARSDVRSPRTRTAPAPRVQAAMERRAGGARDTASSSLQLVPFVVTACVRARGPLSGPPLKTRSGSSASEPLKSLSNAQPKPPAVGPASCARRWMILRSCALNHKRFRVDQAPPMMRCLAASLAAAGSAAPRRGSGRSALRLGREAESPARRLLHRHERVLHGARA